MHKFVGVLDNPPSHNSRLFSFLVTPCSCEAEKERQNDKNNYIYRTKKGESELLSSSTKSAKSPVKSVVVGQVIVSVDARQMPLSTHDPFFLYTK